MTEKEYKLERWTDTSLYYSFPTGNVHQSIGYVIEKVEKDLNQLAEENEQLKSEYKVLHTQYQDLKKFVENNFDEHLTQEKLNRQIIKLSDENEQLKGAIAYYELLLMSLEKEAKRISSIRSYKND